MATPTQDPTATPTLVPTATTTPVPIPPVSQHATFDRPDDTPHRNQIHFVYAIASDVDDSEYDTNGVIAESAAAINDWLVLNGASTLAYDTYKGELDITFVRLQRTARDYKNTRNDLSITLRRDLKSLGLRDRTKLYAVFFQGTHEDGPDGGACGRGGTDFVFTYAWNPCASIIQAKNESGNLSVTSSIMAHEILHGLGAVPDCAPNKYAYDGHTDSPNYDLMSKASESVVFRRQGNAVLDPGRDDYFGHGLADCDDVANSAFFDPLPERWLESPTGLNLGLRSITVDSIGTTHAVGFVAWTDPDNIDELYNEHVQYEISSYGKIQSWEPTSKYLLAIHSSLDDTVFVGGWDGGTVLGTTVNGSVDWWDVPHSAFNGAAIWAISSSPEFIFAASSTRVAKFDYSGQLRSSWNVVEEIGDIRSISINSKRDIFLGSETGIHKYSENGTYSGIVDTGITGWQRMAIDSDDFMYVIGEATDVTVTKDEYGTSTLTVGQGAKPPVIILDESGQQVGELGTWGLYGNQLQEPNNISVGPNGEIVLADQGYFVRVR